MGPSSHPLVWPIGRRRVLVSLAGYLSVSQVACHPASEQPVAIAFVGYGPAARFSQFTTFKLALRQHRPGLFARAQFDYLAAPDDDDQRMATLIRQAAARRPAVLVAVTGTSAAIAAREAPEVPIVFASFVDPVRAGFVRSLRQPGGRITGISLADRLDAKRLEILSSAFPTARRIAVLTDRSWAENYDGEAELVRSAGKLGLDARVLYGVTANDIERLMGHESAPEYDAWYVIPTYLAYTGEARIAAHLKRLGVPGMFGTTGEVARGGALGYEQDGSFVFPTLAKLVARVVAGENAGSIPVERPRRFKLAVRAGATMRSQPMATRVIQRADLVF